MRHKQTDEHKLSYFSLKAILNTILRMENIEHIYHKHKIREIFEVRDQNAATRFLGKSIQISTKNYF